MDNQKYWIIAEIVIDIIIGLISLYYYLKYKNNKKAKTWAYINLGIIIVTLIALSVALFFLFR